MLSFYQIHPSTTFFYFPPLLFNSKTFTCISLLLCNNFHLVEPSLYSLYSYQKISHPPAHPLVTLATLVHSPETAKSPRQRIRADRGFRITVNGNLTDHFNSSPASPWMSVALPSMDFQRRPAIMPSVALPALGTSRAVSGSLVQLLCLVVVIAAE